MRKVIKRVLVVIGYIVGLFLVVRAAAEPFIIDYGNPESYRQLWGGPTLAGVLIVHMLPGAVSLWLIVRHQKNRRKAF